MMINSSLQVNFEFWKIYIYELDTFLIPTDFSIELDTDINYCDGGFSLI